MNRPTSTKSLSSSRCLVQALLGLVLAQWILIVHILTRHSSPVLSASASFDEAGNDNVGSAKSQSVTKCHLSNDSYPSHVTSGKWEGVAVCLMLRRPLWFYKRYNIMVHNAIMNTPSTWAIQLMVNPDWFEKEVLTFHRGLRRLLESHPRVIVTNLPPSIATKKPNGLLREKWVWENVVSDRVLLFHGDGSLCANSKMTWSDFEGVDYVGIPWGHFDGMGGSGSQFSIRSRSAMLAALEHNAISGMAEDQFFVSTLLKLNEDAGFEKFKVASPEVTDWFGGTSNLLVNGTIKIDPGDWGPMVIAGTQAHLPDDARNWVIGICPEIKAIFPSLHNPSCFGARPNPAGCAASLGFPPPCDNYNVTDQ